MEDLQKSIKYLGCIVLVRGYYVYKQMETFVLWKLLFTKTFFFFFNVEDLSFC